MNNRAARGPLLNQNKRNGFLEGAECGLRPFRIRNSWQDAHPTYINDCEYIISHIFVFIKTPNGPRRCVPCLDVCLFVNRTQRKNDCVPVAVLFSIFLELQLAELPSYFQAMGNRCYVSENGRPTWTSAIAAENRLTICIYRWCTRTYRHYAQR